MAVAYFRLNNMCETLNVMEKAIKCIQPYYASTHRMFASFNFMNGYFLIQNDKASEAIECLKKSLENRQFSTDKDFLGIVYTLLVIGCIRSGNLDRAEEYYYQILRHQLPTVISIQVFALLKAIPRQFILDGIRLGQQVLSIIVPNSNTLPEFIDEQTCS